MIDMLSCICLVNLWIFIIPTRQYYEYDFPFHLLRFSLHKIFSINLVSQITRHLNASAFFPSLSMTRSVSHSKAKNIIQYTKKSITPILLIKMSVTPFRSQFLCQEDRRICHKNFPSIIPLKKLFSPKSKVVCKSS